MITRTVRKDEWNRISRFLMREGLYAEYIHLACRRYWHCNDVDLVTTVARIIRATYLTQSEHLTNTPGPRTLIGPFGTQVKDVNKWIKAIEGYRRQAARKKAPSCT